MNEARFDIGLSHFGKKHFKKGNKEPNISSHFSNICFLVCVWMCSHQPGALSPLTRRLLKYLLPSFSEQQHGPVRLIQQVSDMDPQVAGLVSPGRLSARGLGASVGLPDLREQRGRLRHQLGQVGRTVLQAQAGVGAQLVELLQSLEGLVHQLSVLACWELGAWTCCCHHVAVVCERCEP